MQSLKGDQAAAGQQELAGKAALIASVGGQRGWADWTNPDHRLRRLLSEFLGMAGLTFVLSGGAAILARYGGHGLQPWQTVLVLSLVSALWLVVAVYFLADISAHFNLATTLAFALRRDMDCMMAGAYWVVQFAAAICGSLLARGFFGSAGLPRLRGPGRVHPGTHRGGVRAVRRRDQAARPGSGAAGLACRAPDAQVRADLGGQRRVRRAAEDRDLTQLRIPGFPAGAAAGRGTP